MTEETKEINIAFPGQILDYVDTKEHLLELFNYITNLQQENEKLKYNARGQVNDYFKDKYADEVLKKADLIKDFKLTCYKNYELKQEIERLNNIIKNLDKMFEYYFIGNKKYDENTVNTIYIKYIKLKELKESDENETK